MNKLFQPSRIGAIGLRNRILRSATMESLADPSGRPTPALLDLYVRLAEGGVGGIITSMVGVDPAGKGASRMCMIDTDAHLDQFAEITRAVHARDTPIILQLAHAGRQTSAAITGGRPVAPSALRDRMFPRDKPRALKNSEVHGIIGRFVDAIGRARDAGFDGIQLHAAHGYLLSQFLSPSTNRRKDQWGGSLRNRFRVLQEILRQARGWYGDYPIWVKINAADAQRNGMRIAEAARIAVLLEEAGCDAIEVSCGVGADGFNTIRMRQRPTRAMLSLVRDLREASWPVRTAFRLLAPVLLKEHLPVQCYNVPAAAVIRSQVSIPVIVVGGLRQRVDLEHVLVNRQADFVSMARPFITEPDLVRKLQSGQGQRSRCVSCGHCALGSLDGPTRCHRFPSTGETRSFVADDAVTCQPEK